MTLIRCPSPDHQCHLPQGVLADVSIATGWCTIALMLCGKFVFQCKPGGWGGGVGQG